MRVGGCAAATIGSVNTERQSERARQYAVCTYALRHDRVADGAEAIFDQALTNGLAAIVAHHWPGAEMKGSSGQALAASGLLKVIKKRGAEAGGGVVHVLHDPAKPLYEDHPALGRLENFTTVDVPAFNEALRVTQAIRHARGTGEAGTTLTERHVEALEKLDFHPALFAISDELIERSQAGTAGRDAAERARAAAYYQALDDDERERRLAIDYEAEHTGETKHGRSVVEECPVCGALALVAADFDPVIEEIGIGFCFVCSYRRSPELAEDLGYERDIERSIDRAMDRD